MAPVSPPTKKKRRRRERHVAEGNQLARLALDANELAAALGCSRAQIYVLDRLGKLPRPIRLGAETRRAPRWVASEITAWLAAGGPDRQQWERMKRDAS